METKKTCDDSTVKQRKLTEILNELNSIEQYCMDQNFTRDEMKTIFEPLKNIMCIKTYSITTWLGLILLMFGVMIGAYYTEFISWHITVVIRLFLVNILPIFDWTQFSKTHCLFSKPEVVENSNLTLNQINCDVCESVYNVTILSQIDTDLIEQRYFSVFEPFILPFEKSFKYDVKNITEELSNDPYLLSSMPCDLSTNLIATKKVTVDMLFDRSTSGHFNNWFIHFRNCDAQTVKYIRYLFQKSNTYKSMYRTNSNWIILSNKYFSESFKSLDIEYGSLIIVTQLKGGNFIELNPVSECTICHSLQMYLPEEKSLIFISNLWKFAYKPDPNIENNLAVIEEMFWED